jgi:chaperonin GroES
MSTKLKPIGDKVLIEPTPVSDKIGIIYLPENAKEKPLKGVVVALGAGKVNSKGIRRVFEVKAGDKILVCKYAGTEVKIDGKMFNLVHADDILAVIN